MSKSPINEYQTHLMPGNITFAQEEQSDYKCYLFGCGNCIIVTPAKKNTPNWFWRWMQYLCFGNKWVKEKKI